MDPAIAYQTVSLMEGVVLRGTATRLTLLGFPVGGKTGTTNDARDAWFVGFTPNLVFGCYVGFDNPKSLGDKASGGAICGPIFDRFMRKAMADRTPENFTAPDSVELVKIDRNTGERVSAEVFGRDVIFEAFREGTAPIDWANESIIYSDGQPTYIDQGIYGVQNLEAAPPAPGNQPYYGQPGQQAQQPGIQQPPTNRQAAPRQTGAQQPGLQQGRQPVAQQPRQPFPGQQQNPGQRPQQQQPQMVFDPATGQMIVAREGLPGGFPPPQGQPLPPAVTGNSSQDLQGGRGLY